MESESSKMERSINEQISTDYFPRCRQVPGELLLSQIFFTKTAPSSSVVRVEPDYFSNFRTLTEIEAHDKERNSNLLTVYHFIAGDGPGKAGFIHFKIRATGKMVWSHYSRR